MARYIGPKDKLSRREGVDLFGKGPEFGRLNVPPGQHGHKGTRKLSEYGKQLREKQKVKRLYGILEKQFNRYVQEASQSTGKTGEALIQILEMRLDNVVYRLGFASSRPAARQLVSHGHVFVNSKKLTIPSYHVKVGDVITLSSKIQKTPSVIQLLSQENPVISSWLVRKAVVGKVESVPKREDVTESIDEQSIIEFYSR